MNWHKEFDALRHRFDDEPVFWAVWHLLQRALHMAHNAVIARAVGAPGMKLGVGSTLRGVRRMRFGKSFSAHGRVWIEAVTTYGGRTHFPCLTIGNDVSVSDDLHISCIERIDIGNGVLFGSRVYVSDHNHGNYRGETPSSPNVPPARRLLGGGGPVIIEDNVWIGHNVVIVGPAFIGESSIVGANSVVRGHVAPRTIVAGSPARPVKQWDAEQRLWK